MLDFPNQEVKAAFQTYFLAHYTGKMPVATDGFSFALIDSLVDGDPKTFIDIFNSFMAGVPYDLHIKVERY